MVFTFIISGVATSSADSADKEGIKNQEKDIEETSLSPTITLYRHGIDGSVTPIKIQLNLDGKEDIGEAILDKCEELFKNDAEFKKLMNLSNFSFGFFSIVRSKGRGFHYKMKLLGKLTIRYILFRLGLPRVHSLVVNPLVICRYKDSQAKTTIKPLVLKNKSREIEGKHTVIVHRFFGFTTWSGRFSFSPLDIFPRSFFGLAKFAICLRV